MFKITCGVPVLVEYIESYFHHSSYYALLKALVLMQISWFLVIMSTDDTFHKMESQSETCREKFPFGICCSLKCLCLH